MDQVNDDKCEFCVTNILIYYNTFLGTGLPSIVAHKLGISHVIASDLPRAMPLLYYNLIENIAPNSQHESHSFVMPTNRDLCCPSGHLLQDEHVFSDEFMCSVCGEDIEENVFVKRCQRCNFDLCHENCLAAISRGGLEDLPLWFQTELRFRSQFGLPDMNTYHHEFPDVSVDSLSRKGSVSLLSFDWMNDASRIQLQRTIQSKACSSVFIVGADISYSPQSVDIIMSMLPKLVSDMRMSGVQVRILLMHQVRSMLTTSKLLHALAAANWRIERRLIEVSSNTSSLGDLQESEESSIDMSLGGDMAVVQNGIYLIDVIVD